MDTLKNASDAILSASYIDLLYSGRNKAYGGYELRRNYARRTTTALALLLGGGTLLALLASANTGRNTSVGVRPDQRVVVLTTISPPAPIKPIQVLPPPPTAPVRTEVARHTVPLIADDTKVPPKDLSKNMSEAATPGPNEVHGDPGTGTGNTGPQTYQAPLPAAPPPPAPKPFTIVEHMPSPDFNLNEYLEHNLHYPEAARMANIQGRVLLSFIINEDGSISGVQVVRGIGGECDQEALRVIASMPRWKPGMQNGSPVKVVFTLPVLFTLD